MQRLLRGEQVRRAVANWGWLMADRLLRMGIGLFVVVLVARHLGPADYGALTYAGALVASFGSLASLGLDALAVRDLVRMPVRTGEILGTMFAMRLAGAAASVLISLAVVWWFKHDDALAVELVAILSMVNVFLAADAVDLWLQSRVLGRTTVIARALPLLTMAAVRIVLTRSAAPVEAFAIVTTAEAALVVVSMVIAYRWRGESYRTWSVSRVYATKVLVEGWPLFLSALVVTARLRIEQILLGQFAGYEPVAQYAVAGRVVDVWTVVPMTLMVSLFPAIIRAKERGGADYLVNLQRLYDGLIWAAALFAALVWAIGPAVIVWLFSARYEPAGTVLTVLIWSCVWMSFALTRGRWLVAEGHIRDAMMVEAAILIVGLVANLILIPAYGVRGAAMANLSALLLGNLLVACVSAPVRLSLGMFGRTLLLPLRLFGGRSVHGS